METKIAGATFVTLAIIFVAMFGLGDSELENDRNQSNEDSLVTQIGDYIFSNPQPDTSAQISIELNESKPITIQSNTTTVQGMRNIEGSTGIESDEDLSLKNFEGEVSMDTETNITGSASGFENSQIDVDTDLQIEERLETENITSSGIDRQSFDLDVENVELESSEQDSRFENTNTTVMIQSFSGDIEFLPPNRIIFDGEISKADIGGTTFGE